MNIEMFFEISESTAIPFTLKSKNTEIFFEFNFFLNVKNYSKPPIDSAISYETIAWG